MEKKAKYVVFYDDVDILKTCFVAHHEDSIVFDKFSDAKKSLIDYHVNSLAHAKADLLKSRSIKEKSLKSD